MFIEPPPTTNQLSSVRSETIRIHIALLMELGRIGIVEFYIYLVPNGTNTSNIYIR
ncbi:MAG: hypothetical protein QOG23_59 [Blastocatellia bacterium]|jgi:hypothetical protein|nr:hypothetical protein [Blastocatellia bacterium]